MRYFIILIPLFLLFCGGLFISKISSEYLILFQNNFELRPTGGFMGSYARMRAAGLKVTDFTVQDIYVPDGQMQGHVEPPWPIQTTFGQGWYRLRDSNWNPDFPVSAQTILWFFEKGGESQANGIIATDLEVFGSVLDVLGPITLPDEKEKLTKENFYQLMQSEAEIGFFPGSQQKQVYLSKVAKATLAQLEVSTLEQKIRLAQSLWRMAKEKHIQIFSHDRFLQKIISWMGFDGAFKRVGNLNYFSLIEANLGSNKANCCIKRSIQLSADSTQHYIAKILFDNNNPTSLKNPPYSWGGVYVSYIRVYVPIEASNIKVEVDGEEKSIKYQVSSIKEEPSLQIGLDWKERFATHSAMKQVEIENLTEKRLTSIGFFVAVDALEKQDVRLEYSLPDEPRFQKLCIQKQAGTKDYQFANISLDRDSCLMLPYSHGQRK